MPSSQIDKAWTDRVRSVYDRSARGYDCALSLFPAVGFRTGAYRRHAIDALHVRSGDTVLDLGCGTGRNLPLLAHAVGEGGCVVGLDVSQGALDRARRRTRELPQVELSMMPDPGAVVARAAAALAPGGRLSVLDFRIPRSWPGLVQTAAFRLVAPLGETWEMARRNLRPVVAAHVALDTDRSFFWGSATLSAGGTARP